MWFIIRNGRRICGIRWGDIHNHDGKVEVEDTLRTHPLDKTYMNVKVCYEVIHKNHDMMHDMH